ncbi:hypothetical protein J2Z31_002913 [Sinorhizobium kostiense]|uniref:Transmembrane protein n=1 Tax=Sinorhizobium kostiense TaxID=76747 RepID=A0ABS4R272_9HYPH|nr:MULTISPECIES: hypothetical protein [Sinorhizobium]MBP2236399.1 hypothetical protein [Sinorhizobium kostiense]
MSAIARDPVPDSTFSSNQRISAPGPERRSPQSRSSPFTSAVASGTIASLVTTAALALFAGLERRSVFQPTNATSHWLHGENAGRIRIADAKHTLLGYCTHHLSAIFWALPFEAWLAADRSREPTVVLRKAALTAAVAYLVDYHLVPKRLTPGWETVLSKRSIGMTYAALALGLAAGAMLSRKAQHPSHVAK